MNFSVFNPKSLNILTIFTLFFSPFSFPERDDYEDLSLIETPLPPSNPLMLPKSFQESLDMDQNPGPSDVMFTTSTSCINTFVPFPRHQYGFQSWCAIFYFDILHHASPRPFGIPHDNLRGEVYHLWLDSNLVADNTLHHVATLSPFENLQGQVSLWALFNLGLDSNLGPSESEHTPPCLLLQGLLEPQKTCKGKFVIWGWIWT